MAWNKVSDGYPRDDGEYFVAYRGSYGWNVMTSDWEGDKFNIDNTPPYVELWMEIPEFPYMPPPSSKEPGQ